MKTVICKKCGAEHASDFIIQCHNCGRVIEPDNYKSAYWKLLRLYRKKKKEGEAMGGGELYRKNRPEIQ